MLKLARWCIAHRRSVFVAWVAIAVLTTLLAGAVGRDYSTNFSLPGTDTQRAYNLINRDFAAASGDSDQIVFHISGGTVDTPAVRAAITALLGRVSGDPHVLRVISPYTRAGALQVSRDGATAFAIVSYSKVANDLPTNTGDAVLTQIKAVHVPGLEIAAGGQVIENAEGLAIGPATVVGVIAALIILLFTFGSIVAAGMPLVTAGFGLVTGLALIGIATHLTSMSNITPELALMIGLGVGIDYALFIVTRFRENYAKLGNVEASVLQAMDTSGRAILLAGTTVIIALLGMFATAVPFMYGLAIGSALTVLMTLIASLTVLPAILSRYGQLVLRPLFGRSRRHGSVAGAGAGAGADGSRNAGADGSRNGDTDRLGAHAQERSRWRAWSRMVQARPWTLACASLGIMLVLLIPVFGMRLQSTDAGNDPSSSTTRHAFDLLAAGFGPGFNGPLLVAAELSSPARATALPALRSGLAATPGIVAVTAPRIAPSGTFAVVSAYPATRAQAAATTDLVNRLRAQFAPAFKRRTGVTVLIGGFTAGGIDFSHVLASKLPVFIAIVVLLSALLLFVIFRSVLIPVQAALMNLLSIAGALGVTVAVFQNGWLGGLFGVQQGPIEPWIPVLMFAVVFGLSMDYEVFLVSRVREEWIRRGDASSAVADGIAYTGRVISAAAAIMICVFLSFMLGDERSIKEFGFGLAIAVFLDALVVRCVLLPAVLELLGKATWWLPSWVDARLPSVNIEGSAARAEAAQRGAELPAEPVSPAPAHR
ncbi:MAG: MMPL family transporter [Solirubrobacteraceae bacterium]